MTTNTVTARCPVCRYKVFVRKDGTFGKHYVAGRYESCSGSGTRAGTTSITIKKEVDEIIAVSHDPEDAHGKEDDLLLKIVYAYAPPDVIKEIERLKAANLKRWYG